LQRKGTQTQARTDTMARRKKLAKSQPGDPPEANSTPDSGDTAEPSSLDAEFREIDGEEVEPPPLDALPEVEAPDDTELPTTPSDSEASAEPAVVEGESGESRESALPVPAERSLVRPDPLTVYVQEIRRFPLLSREQEHELAVRYFEHGDVDAAR